MYDIGENLSSGWGDNYTQEFQNSYSALINPVPLTFKEGNRLASQIKDPVASNTFDSNYASAYFSGSASGD